MVLLEPHAVVGYMSETVASVLLAKRGIFLQALQASRNKQIWIVDSGASDHMTDCPQLFTTYVPCAGSQKVKIADGSLAPIAGKGSIRISEFITLESVLHVPKLACNLLSVSQLTKQANYCATFLPSHCVFQDLSSGMTIGRAKEYEGLYFLDDVEVSHQHPIRVCNSVSTSRTDDIMLWHKRMGHPNFHYLSRMFPSLYPYTSINMRCEICELAKHHRSSYPRAPYTPSKPFTTIHSDLWGPSRIPNRPKTKWFISFIDDHTRLCWVYLLKDKSEAPSTFMQFFNLVKNQFDTNIKVLHSDNGTEYFNHTLSAFLQTHGIIHKSSCPNTPQQNGIAERKNRHILDVARALMLTSNVPKFYWGDAILHATYLINRMPSRVISFQTPLQRFKSTFPTTHLETNLPFRVFGCSVYVNMHSNSKFDPHAVKCIFLGIPSTKKGYMCFCYKALFPR